MLSRLGTTLFLSALALASFVSQAEASVALVPGAPPVVLPPTAAVAESDLAGVVVQDNLIPFRIVGAGGALLFEGKLQNRIVRSSETGLLHFYYRIRDTRPGLNGIVRAITTRSYATSPRILAGYRPDGLGTIPPTLAIRSVMPGESLRFNFNINDNVLVGGRESRFIFAKTMVKGYNNLGQTRIELRSGESTVVQTLAPLPPLP
jgi:hypothetical protein